MSRRLLFMVRKWTEFEGTYVSEDANTITFVTDEGITKQLAKIWLVKENDMNDVDDVTMSPICNHLSTNPHLEN